MITIRAGEVSGAYAADLSFEGNSTAGNATFLAEGHTLSGAWDSHIDFRNSSSAGNATFNYTGGAYIDFHEESTAATAHFTSDGSSVLNPTASIIRFWDSSGADQITAVMNGATTSNVDGADGGHIFFFSTATAESGHFTLNGSTVNNARGASTDFLQGATAADSTFILNGGTTNGALGGLLRFRDSATADNATLIANTGSPGPRGGGRIYFEQDSTGGTARLKVFGIGKLDLSVHVPVSVTVGSIEGDGNIFLGLCNLVAGGNNSTTAFSGVIQDGGLNGGVGGSLTKVGNGTLSLGNLNTYSGGTSVSSGTLVAAHDGALGTGNVTVAAGTTLTLQGGANTNYIADAATLSVVNGSTVSLNFSGNPEVVGFFESQRRFTTRRFIRKCCQWRTKSIAAIFRQRNNPRCQSASFFAKSARSGNFRHHFAI